MILKTSAVVVLMLVAFPSPSHGGAFNLFSDFFGGLSSGLSPRQGRNSKLMNFGQEPSNAALPLKIKVDEDTNEEIKQVVEGLTKEFEQEAVERVEHDLKEIEEAVTEVMMNDLIKEIVGGQDSIRDQFQKRPAQPKRQFPRPQEVDSTKFDTGASNFKNYQSPQAIQKRTGYAPEFQYPGQEQQYNSNRGQYPRANGLSADFGPNMGADAIADPDNNVYSRQPQLDQEDVAALRQQDSVTEAEAPSTEVTTTLFPSAPGSVDLTDSGDDEVRCINKVMQVEETVYEERIKCQHTFTEKCHDTFITDYVPTQEKKCETSFKKNCHIYYKPMMFEESVDICNEPLKKVCNDDIQGENICKTHYETVCETRYREHEVEQDEPVCEMVIERRCNGVTVPLPGDSQTRFRRQAPALTDLELSNNDLNADFGFLQNNDFVNIGSDCEEWPVQKCRLEKKLVKKTNPETSCQKMPREICAPSNCELQKSEKVCRQEVRNLVQNIPSEQCDLEPQENCKMETVLVPRLVQQPNCIKVPKEVCVNAKTNPKKVKKPIIKEWCYRPSDLRAPDSRLALSQFFRN